MAPRGSKCLVTFPFLALPAAFPVVSPDRGSVPDLAGKRLGELHIDGRQVTNDSDSVALVTDTSTLLLITMYSTRVRASNIDVTGTSLCIQDVSFSNESEPEWIEDDFQKSLAGVKGA